jgi:hypothetical protein
MLCFDLESHSGEVFWIPLIGMSDDEVMVQDYSFVDVAKAIGNDS